MIAKKLDCRFMNRQVFCIQIGFSLVASMFASLLLLDNVKQILHLINANANAQFTFNVFIPLSTNHNTSAKFTAVLVLILNQHSITIDQVEVVKLDK